MANSIYQQLALSLVVAVATAVLTVWLALQRFYKEKWWEAKMRAYTDIIEALHHMRRNIEISLEAEYEGRQTDSDFHREWKQKHKQAWDEVRKYADVGEFVISAAAARLLQVLIVDSKWEKLDLYIDYLEASEIAVNKCLPSLKRVAREDLRLRRGSLL